MIIMLLSSRSSFERSGAMVYFVYINFFIGVFMLGSLGFNIASVMFLLIVYAKLPLNGLHIWLLKVHVEANMFTSILLAGLVLKVGSVLLFTIGNMSILILLFTIRTLLILNINDGKVVVRISSVVHMSMCLLVGIVFYGRFSHIIVSPLMFISVYYSYLYMRNRGI